jgi:cyclopropane fatty-acyl-phospholipid synthase-like methyltransferase
MIIIVFILLLFTLYSCRYFENKRNARNEEQHEKRREAFNNLLEKLKEKKSTDETNI